MYRPYWNYYGKIDQAERATAPSGNAWVALGILIAIYALAVIALFWTVS